mmetsp:Transcript_31623/g.80651  ORF Transcript_31623/g.80651 Transcript_31623/m.80651 type:complete len:758 (-) Transcript_31623:1874-4147(-)|eukprot:CAMPEP_0202858128 /NCGR_PEP_ID=MMETSP1391-20130828/792_1 /ASSEMBLY_ACC=CAM_ASM_000867 /TAXON_ID=1034604 /ORGANISM="Chlamydomonas leiostraca, Strain SAG 11-49" /LENGTH=757 /DNA_ID=CAMNT_0049537013 /DNA_START=23 /DNA_END=2296 /DNA_ORIENTATION=+
MAGDQGVHQPLLSGADGSNGGRVVVQVGGRPSTAAHRAHVREAQHATHGMTTKGAALIGIVGIVIVLGAAALHYSGLEPQDLATSDDKCFTAADILIDGLPLDACLSRESVDAGTECGAGPADLYCKKIGGNYHVNFTLGDVKAKRGAITAGNKFIGGMLGFEEICCDVDQYAPAVSRWALLVGGTFALYGAAFFAARLLLALLEGMAALFQVEAGEALYFLLGVDHPLRWIIFTTWLVMWADYVLWVVWCNKGIDCEAHGSTLRDTIYQATCVARLFAAAALFAKAAPRIISVRYLYKGQFAKVRDTMRKESLLSALTSPEVRTIVQQRRDAQHAAAEAAENAAAGAAVGGDRRASVSMARRRSLTGHRNKASSKNSLPSNLPDLTAMLETTGYGTFWGSGGAVDRFRHFLAHYSLASEDDVAAEASAEGEVLYDNLVGAWDTNDDGSVGLQDFQVLFRRARSPPGFNSADDAAEEAWAMFDLDRDGKLVKEEVVAALSNIYRDRTNTARTVLSNESAVNSLEAAIGFVVYTLLLFVAAHMLGVTSNEASTSSLDFFTTYILALSFIFGDTVRSVFRSTLYLFGEQPFAVGDWLCIDDEVWCVESFDLIYTQMRKWEENLFAKVPNDMLIDSKLINLSRGGAFKDSMAINVPLAMPIQSIQDLKDKLLEAGAERSKDIDPDSPHVKIDSIESGQVMCLVAEWVYAFPPGDRPRMDDARDFMVAAVRAALNEIGVTEQELRLEFRMAKKAAGKAGGK